MGFATCGGPSCQVRTTSDPRHCGACNRSCRDGECHDSECLPVAVVRRTDIDGYGAFDVNAAGVYWATMDSRVLGRAFGTATDRPVATEDGRIWRLAVDAEFAYLVVEGKACGSGTCLRRLRLVPDGSPATTLIPLPAISGDFFLEGGFLYWADANGHISRLDTRASGTPEEEVLAAGQDRGTGLASDGQYLYWGSTRADGGILKRQSLDRIDLSPEPVVTEIGSVAAVAVNGTHVFWTESDTAMIRMAPKGGGAPITLLSGQPQVDHLVADDWNVYWSGQAGMGRAVNRLSTCGGPPKALFPALYPSKLLIFDGYVYWLALQVGVFRSAQ